MLKEFDEKSQRKPKRWLEWLLGGFAFGMLALTLGTAIWSAIAS